MLVGQELNFPHMSTTTGLAEEMLQLTCDVFCSLCFKLGKIE